jgi:predicted unusual protein kinase regulating ubiquinone biosynthesis (AarF/ABC1/UbiB family)
MTVRSAFADSERRDDLRARFELQTAEQVAAELGNMKGAVMKIGQMASYLDQGLPEPVREALAQLQTDAPPMSFDLMAEVVSKELGDAPDRIFDGIDRQPLAAASIGQVHRARTRSGADVAVKVQYPGVAAAIRADLDNSDLLFNMMSMLFPGMDPGPIVGELRDRISEELDYRNEARHQQRFADHYRDHPTIRVPDVHAELSTGRVLTADFVDGARWSEMLTWDDEQRDLAAETIYRYAFGGIYRMGLFNGDPHPGNYLFHGDGVVTFLDYGLTKEFEPQDVAAFEGLIDAMVLNPDMAAFRRLSREVGVLKNDHRFTDAQIRDYFEHFYEFVMRDEVRTITAEYASESVRRYFDLSSPHAEIMKSANLPASMVIIQRINLGLFALFGEMKATANWRRLGEEIWPMTSAPPSTPMGERIREWEQATGRR